MASKYKAVEFKAATHHAAFVDNCEPWNNSPAYELTPDFTANELLKVWRGR